MSAFEGCGSTSTKTALAKTYKQLETARDARFLSKITECSLIDRYDGGSLYQQIP